MGTLSMHLGELAEALQELRRRMRHTARVEVARALGEALRELTLAMICGPARYGAPRNAFPPGTIRGGIRPTIRGKPKGPIPRKSNRTIRRRAAS
jgi:hypothetical protein